MRSLPLAVGRLRRMAAAPETHRGELLVVFLTFAIVRTLGAFAVPQYRLQPDATEYRYLAAKLAESGEYTFAPDWRSVPWLKKSWWTYLYDASGSCRVPGFPFLLALVRPVVGNGEAAINALLALLEALSGVLLFLIARLIFGPPVARTAALLYLPNPGSLLSMACGCRESLITLLVLLGIYLVLRSADGSAWSAVLAGLTLGLAGYVKDNAVLVALFAGMWLAILAWRRGKGRLGQAAIIVACAALTCAPWVIRNSLAYHKLTGMSTIGGLALWHGIVDQQWPYDAAGKTERDYIRGLSPADRARLDPYKAQDARDADARLTEIVKMTIARQPAVLWRAMRRNVGLFWSPVSKIFMEYGFQRRPLELLPGAYYLACFALAAAGFWRFRNQPETWLVILVLAGVTLLHSVTFAAPRFRMPFDPLLLIYAAAVLCRPTANGAA